MQSRRGAAASGAPFLFAATRPPPPAPACASRAVRFSPKIARHHPESTRITVGRRFASWLRTAARRARRLVSRPPRGAARGRHGGRGRGQGRTLLVRRRVTERDVALRMRVRVDDDATRMSCAAPGRRLWHVLLEGRSPGTIYRASGCKAASSASTEKAAETDISRTCHAKVCWSR